MSVQGPTDYQHPWPNYQLNDLHQAIANVGWANVTNSVAQTNENRFQINDGTVVYSGLTSSRDIVEIGEEVRRRLQLGRDVDGVSDTLTLCVSYTQNNGDVLYKFGWEEVSN
jgi:hypothetical protein